jgi:hypothetical protein
MAIKSALCADRLLPPGKFMILISVRGWADTRDIIRVEILRQLKNSMTLSGIEPVTFLLAAQWLNQLRHGVPPNINLVRAWIDDYAEDMINTLEWNWLWQTFHTCACYNPYRHLCTDNIRVRFGFSCHYTISGCHSNQLLSANTMHERLWNGLTNERRAVSCFRISCLFCDYW